jgi:hypothetical protein
MPKVLNGKPKPPAKAKKIETEEIEVLTKFKMGYAAITPGKSPLVYFRETEDEIVEVVQGRYQCLGYDGVPVLVIPCTAMIAIGAEDNDDDTLVDRMDGLAAYYIG